MNVRPEYRKNRKSKGTGEESGPESLSEAQDRPVGNKEAPGEGQQGGGPASREGAERPSNVNLPQSTTGRPSKKALAAKKPGGRGKPGRPKGDAAILNEYKARMLNSPKSRKVLDKVFEVALDDEHKHQAVCLKLVMDRIAPLGSFELDAKGGKAAGGINITINGVSSVGVNETSVVDGEWEPVDA